MFYLLFPIYLALPNHRYSRDEEKKEEVKSYLSFGRWFGQSGVQRLKRVVEDMTHSQRRHALTIQLVDIGTHIQQQLDHIILAVHLTVRRNKTRRSEKQKINSQFIIIQPGFYIEITFVAPLCYSQKQHIYKWITK